MPVSSSFTYRHFHVQKLIGFLLHLRIFVQLAYQQVSTSDFFVVSSRCRRLEEASEQSLMFEIERNRKLEALGKIFSTVHCQVYADECL